MLRKEGESMKKVISIILIMISIFIIFSMQNFTNAANTTGHTAGEVISEADDFIKTGGSNSSKLIDDAELKNLSDTIYNVLLVVGIIAAVIIGLLLGIKFITSGVEGKAEVQKALIIYIIGCVVVFGAFTIWKIVVTVLRGM